MMDEKMMMESRSEERSASASEATDVEDVREYLREIRHKYLYAQVLCERAQRYREMAMRATGRVTATRLSGTPRRSSLEDNVLSMMDTHRELQDQIRELMCETRRAEKLIASLGDERCHAVLQLRYLCGMSWEEVAEKLNYSVRWVHKLHGQAIRKLEKLTQKRGH